MEQQNKYYTPDAADIYPGYEYEFNGNKINYESVGEWSKNIAGTEPEECSILDQWGLYYGKPSNYYIQQGWVRTKYLDREDIESLGWIDGITEGNTSRYNMSARDYKDRIFLLVDNPTRQIRIVLQKGLGDTLFWGECKSKNELRKIMQWIGIL
jgi:hypothetical protein